MEGFEELYINFTMLLTNLGQWFLDILVVLTNNPIMFFLVMIPVVLFIASAIFGIIKTLFVP